MANKMIIDASHPEETRVVVLRGSRVEEFDFESASKRPLRGNIYLAKVTRVEPSLQAAFVDYGGNRHGFLAFSEIHPDYYQIPVADRQALLDEEAQTHQDEDDEPRGERRSRRHRRPREAEVEARVRDADDGTVSEIAPAADDEAVIHDERAGEARASAESAESEIEVEAVRSDVEATPTGPGEPAETEFAAERRAEVVEWREGDASPAAGGAETRPTFADESSQASPARSEDGPDEVEAENAPYETLPAVREPVEPVGADEKSHDDEHEVTTLEGGSEERIRPIRRERAEDEGEPVEHIGGDAWEEMPRRPQRLRRQYKIQEVIKRRQVMLVQVVKEERGNKGAALTTYLSLAGRYCVLMPNTARGGGISRKITNAQDRSRLKGIAEELDVPEGMGVDLAHGRRLAHQGRGQARLRISAPDVGDGARDHPLLKRADARL